MKAFLKYHHALMLLNQGGLKEIRGTIVNFQPRAPPGKGHPKESFSVCGVTFAYDPNAIEPGYRETRNQGAPIDDGVSVQITYVDEMILRLKICEKQIMPSECGNFHAVIDEGIYDKHDDPQNFEFAVFDETWRSSWSG